MSLPKPKPKVYVLSEKEMETFVPVAVLVLHPCGDVKDPSAILDVLDTEGKVLRRVLVNGVALSSRTLPLLVDPSSVGYHGGPEAGEDYKHNYTHSRVEASKE